MVALARLVVGLVDVGNFEALRYLGYVLTVFWLNGLGNAYLRVRQTSQHGDRWLTYYLLVSLLGGLLAFALLTTATPLLGSVLLNNPLIDYALPFGTYLLGTVVANAVTQEAIGDGAGGRLLAFSFSTHALQIGLFVGPLLAGLPIYFAMWGLAASAVYNLLWATLRYMRTSDGQLPLKPERQQFWSVASSLSLYGLASMGVLAVDHALVTYFSDTPVADLALWRYGAQELPLLVGIVSGLNATALKEGQAGTTEMNAELRRRSKRVTRIFLPVAIGLAATSQAWFGWLFGAALFPAHVVFNTMLLAVPSRLILTTPSLISADRQGSMVWVGVAANVVNVLLSLALVLPLGMLGIAIGSVVAYAAERLAYVWILRRADIGLGDYLDLREWVLGAAVLLAVYLALTDFGALL